MVRPRFLILFVLVLLAAFAAGGGSLGVRNIEAADEGGTTKGMYRSIACWVTGVLEPDDPTSLNDRKSWEVGWGEDNEFVIDFSDYSNGQTPPDHLDYNINGVRMSSGNAPQPVTPAFTPSGDPLYQCLEGDNDSGGEHICAEAEPGDPGYQDPGRHTVAFACRAYIPPRGSSQADIDLARGSCIRERGGPHQVLTEDDGRRPMPKVSAVETPAFFFSYPELVDYTFAMGYRLKEGSSDSTLPYDRDINDIRTRRIVGLFDGYPENVTGGLKIRPGVADGLGYIPWGFGDDDDANDNAEDEARDYYLKRRLVSQFIGPTPFNGFSAQWYTEGNPSGGVAIDPALLLADQRAVDAELLVSSESAMLAGHRLIQGNQQLSGLDISLERVQICESAGAGVVCTSTSSASSNPVVVWAPYNATDKNSGEVGRIELTDGVLQVAEYDEEKNRVGTDDRRIDSHAVNPSLLKIYKDQIQTPYADIKRPPGGGDEIHIELGLHPRYRNDYGFSVFNDRGKSKIPAFGRSDSVWTYAHYAPSPDFAGRDTALNDMIPGVEVSGSRDDIHLGYRQPRLEWGYRDRDNDNEIVARVVDHIRWPVNLQDLNWYLYRLPESVPGDPQWLLWTDYHGRIRLVQSGFGRSAAPFLPGPLPGEDEVSQPAGAPGSANPLCTLELPAAVPEVDDKPLAAELINCEGFPQAPDWGYGDPDLGYELLAPGGSARIVGSLWSGAQDGVYLPFGVTSADPVPQALLSKDYLVKQGTEHPIGNPGDDNLIGSRQLDQFRWAIDESTVIGAGDNPGGLVGTVSKRYGLPEDAETRDEVLKDWPAEPIDPHKHYLMVVTFYEHRPDGALEFKVVNDFMGGGSGVDPLDESASAMFSLPKRHLRRVVCRILIHPSGITSDVPIQITPSGRARFIRVCGTR